MQVKGKKPLIAYFSHSGNTRTAAEQIRSLTGGELFEIKAVKTYPEDYDAVVEVAKQELKSGFKPELREKAGDMARYDTVFMAYPNWWGTFPAPVKTFLLETDLKGKEIAPLCTHEGSGLGRSAADIVKLCPGSKVLAGLAIWGTTVNSSGDKISEWLEKCGIGV